MVIVNKLIIFAFKGNPVCFMHVLLNALDMHGKGMDAKVIIEGEAVKLVEEMETSNNHLYKDARDKGIIDGICKACSAKMGVLEYNETVGIPLKDDMSGHPSMALYINEGYQIITL